jgi:hypothetical protein
VVSTRCHVRLWILHKLGWHVLFKVSTENVLEYLYRWTLGNELGARRGQNIDIFQRCFLFFCGVGD